MRCVMTPLVQSLIVSIDISRYHNYSLQHCIYIFIEIDDIQTCYPKIFFFLDATGVN